MENYISFYTGLEIDEAVRKSLCPIESIIPSGGMHPDVLYNLGIINGNLNITLQSFPLDNKDHEWMLIFSTGSTAPSSISFPTSVVFPDTPSWEANKHYEISIKWDTYTNKYYAVIQTWSRV